MKKIIVLITLFVSLSACKNDQKTQLTTTANSNLAVYKGEFIFTEGAAVLKGSDFIYGVVVDDKMKELADKVAPAKKDVFDMVPSLHCVPSMWVVLHIIFCNQNKTCSCS